MAEPIVAENLEEVDDDDDDECYYHDRDLDDEDDDNVVFCSMLCIFLFTEFTVHSQKVPWPF